MELTQKQYLSGLDIWKFVMAVLIVAAHCQFLEETTVYGYMEKLESIAVPCFFAISAFLFFRSIYSIPPNENSSSYLWHTLKRLAILFCVWYILVLPMTYMRFYSVATLKEVVFAWCLTQTAQGYWFIKALIYNTLLFYVCRKTKLLWVITIVGWLSYLYLSYNYVYHFNPFIEDLHPYYSFYYHIAYFSTGVWFAKYPECIEKCSTKIIAVLIIMWLSVFICREEWLSPLYRLFSFPLLFPLFYSMRGGNLQLCSTLRKMSIILYMVQFLLIWLYNEGCKLWFDTNSTAFIVLQYSITRFAIILSLSIVIALLILKFEKKPHLAFLKYLH